MSDYSTSFTSCFRPTKLTHPPLPLPPPPPPPISPPHTSHNPNLTTTLYHTDFGLAALTWCRHLIGRSLHIDLHFQDQFDDISSTFHLYMKPLLFWRKHGYKKFHLKSSSSTTLEIHWDLTKSKFNQNPEPQSGFFIAIVVNREMILLVGDSHDAAYAKTKARKADRPQDLILRREHVFGNKLYTTQVTFGGKSREICIDCNTDDEPRLCFSVDGERVLEIKRLKWKFRGNERIEVDGVGVQVSWDVFNWLFDDVEDGHAVFMFRFEEEDDGEDVEVKGNEYLGMNGFERRKLMKNSFKTRSSSSSSISSASSAGSSSVMEWASMEENELHSQSGFSLLVYAWKS